MTNTRVFNSISFVIILTILTIYLASCDNHSTSVGGSQKVSIIAPDSLTAFRHSDGTIITLQWHENAFNESLIFVDRSTFSADDGFIQLVFLPPNSVTYTDSTAPADSVCYYRVMAVAGKYFSLYSNVVTVPVR